MSLDHYSIPVVAMMIECMAGKSASVHGLVHDATPFRFSEEDTGIDYHGKLLEKGTNVLMYIPASYFYPILFFFFCWL